MIGSTATEEPQPAVGSNQDEARQAFAVVETFRRALEDVRVDDAVAVLAPGTRVDLPGLPLG